MARLIVDNGKLLLLVPGQPRRLKDRSDFTKTMPLLASWLLRAAQHSCYRNKSRHWFWGGFQNDWSDRPSALICESQRPMVFPL